MPVIKSAIKKLRRDRKREKQNDLFRKNLDKAVKLAKKQKSASRISEAISFVDRAVKKNILQKNKAARMKSSLAKLARPALSRRAKPADRATSKSPSKSVSKKRESKTEKTKK